MTRPWEKSPRDGELDSDERFKILLDRINFDEFLVPAATEALRFYDDSLPYHNIDHMFEVTENILDLCEIRGITGYHLQALCMAALWHDSDFPRPLDPNDISKENRSAILVNNAILACASDLGANEQKELGMFADLVSTLVLSTHPERVPDNIYEEILNEADLLNLGGDIVVMLQKSTALYVEGLILAGDDFIGSIDDLIRSRISGLSDWCGSTQSFLKDLIKRKIPSEEVLKKMSTNIRTITPNNIINLFKKPD